MRIAFLLGGTDQGRSGIGTYVRQVLPRLHLRADEAGLAIVVLGDPEELHAYQDILSGVEQSALPTALKHPGLSAAWYLVAATHAARRANANIMLLPAANRRMSGFGSLPTVAVVHDLAQLHVAKKYDALRMFYFRRIVVPAFQHARMLVAVSEATRKDLINALQPPRPEIRVIRNGVNVERFSPLEASHPAVHAARSAYGLHEPYILYPSRLEHPGKNHVRLIEAYASSSKKQSHLLAFAGQDWGGAKIIQNTMDRFSVASRVRLLGFVEDALLPGLVAGAEAVAMVGLREGFGLPALEALACGVPVFVSQTGALPEVVGELGVLCDPEDSQSMAKGLERVIDDSELRTRVKHKGPSWAAANSWDVTAEELLRACKRAAYPA